MNDAATTHAIENLYRDSWSRILASLVRQTRDLEAAEDAVQEAIARAIASWPKSGVPENPAGWVHTVARRIAIDNGRRITTLHGKTLQLQIPDDEVSGLHAADLAFGDDRLRLIFTCCHPVLTEVDRMALTLRVICGLSTAEIARLFLVQESTMAARITRAKKKLTASGVSYQVPSPSELDQRLQDVLQVVYLVAASAHMPGSGTGLHNTTQMSLALDLTKVLLELMPGQPEVMSLRALVFLAESRKETRLDPDGNALPLQQMDRSLWNADLIAQAKDLTEQSLRKSDPDMVGRYTLQAAIAMVHAEATQHEQTDWAQIAALYAILDHRYPSAIVRLGYAIAMGMRDGPSAGLTMIAQSQLEESLAGYPMFPAALADLHRRAGDFAIAGVHYREAAALTGNVTMAEWFTEQASVMDRTDDSA